MANHELLNQLAICSWILDKLRSIQKQCQYSIDKLLDHSKRAIENDNSVNQLNLNDELSQKPDLMSLRPPNANENELENNNKDITMNDIEHEVEMNKDGIYRPLKLNPTLMDTPKNILTKKQERTFERFKKNVRNSDIYQVTRETMTNLPTEEKFYLQNVDKFSKTGSKSKLRDIENYEEENYGRLAQSNRETKRVNTKRKLREASIGDNLDSFIDSLDKSFKNAKVLGDYQAGATFANTIGKNTIPSNIVKPILGKLSCLFKFG